MKPYQDKKTLEDLYKKHKSIKKVADELGCNEKTANRWMKKHGIKSAGSQGARKHNFNEFYFHEIDEENKAYWLGFIMADGCVYKGSDKHSYRLQINLKRSDSNILEKFQKDIGSDYKISNKSINGSEVSQLKVNSTIMCKRLIDLGVVPRKSLVCEIPKIKKEFIRHFIRGVFDGDGSIGLYKRKKYNNEVPKFTICGSKKMIEDIQLVLLNHQISTGIYDFKRSNVKYLETGKVDSVLSLYDFLYKDSNIYLERKKEAFEKVLKQIVPFRSNPIDKTQVNSGKA